MQILYMTSLHAYFKRHFGKEKLWKFLMFRSVLHPELWASLSPEWGSGYETQMGMWVKTLWLEVSEGMKLGGLLDTYPTIAWILIITTIICFQKVYLECGKRWSFSPSIELSVPQGSLLAVVGQVGAGKSSLLAAVLGELEATEGCVTMKVNFLSAFASYQAVLRSCKGWTTASLTSGRPIYCWILTQAVCISPHLVIWRRFRLLRWAWTLWLGTGTTLQRSSSISSSDSELKCHPGKLHPVLAPLFTPL